MQGLIASLLALLSVEGVRSAATATADTSAVALLNLVAGRPLSVDMTGLLLLLGMLVSLTGSYASVRPST